MSQNQELFSKTISLVILMKDLNGYVTLSFHISQIGNYELRTEKTLANQKKRKCSFYGKHMKV